MVNIKKVGNGQVFLIAGGGKTYADVAAKFCRTEKDVEEIIASPQSKKLLREMQESGHKSAFEFDNFMFGIQGYARVTEVQLVRKRHASYMIKSGRAEENGRRNMDVVLPESIMDFGVSTPVPLDKLHLRHWNPDGDDVPMYIPFSAILDDWFGDSETKELDGHTITRANTVTTFTYTPVEILNLLDAWYNSGVEYGIKEEELRYMKPQATEFKAAIMMNATALRDWALIRACNNAQTEIRDLCRKMIALAKGAAPELFENIGPSCAVYGYCPESHQCEQNKGKIPTKKAALEYLHAHMNDVLDGSTFVD